MKQGFEFSHALFFMLITDSDAIGKKMADILGVPEDYKLAFFLLIGIAIQPLKYADKNLLPKEFGLMDLDLLLIRVFMCLLL